MTLKGDGGMGGGGHEDILVRVVFEGGCGRGIHGYYILKSRRSDGASAGGKRGNRPVAEIDCSGFGRRIYRFRQRCTRSR